MKKYPLVSVIVLNYNGKKHLKSCLSFLKKTKYPNFEVIISDNGSTDGSVEFVKKIKWVKIVENKKNLGFSEGNYRGYLHSKGKYIVLLNNDTVVDNLWLSEMVKVIEKNKKIGACACKVKLFSNKIFFNSAGIEVDIYGFASNRGLPYRGNYEKDVGQYDEIEEVFSAYGAAMIIKRDVIERIGFLNPNFKMWYEEIDFCWRLRLAGYKIFYVPRAIVYHKLFSTRKTAVFSKHQKFFLERNRLKAMLQNYSLRMLIKVMPLYMILKFLEVSFYLMIGKFEDGSSTVRGIFSNLINLPQNINERNYIQNKIRKVSDREIIKNMKKNSIELSTFLKAYRKFL